MKVDIQFNQVLRVWFRNFVIFRRTWLVSLFWVMLEPIFILTALGFGLGAYVKTIRGIPYAEFFFPGLLCSSTMMVAYFEGTYGNYSKLAHSKVYTSQMLSPLTMTELILGDLFWAASKAMMSAFAIILVGLLFGLGQSWGAFPSLLVLFINAWIFSCLGMIITALVRNYDQIIYPTSGFIVPMSLFAGTYFPIEDLRPALRVISYLLPLSHATQVVRSFYLAQWSPILLIHLGLLVVLAYLLTRIAIRKMTTRLQQ